VCERETLFVPIYHDDPVYKQNTMIGVGGREAAGEKIKNRKLIGKNQKGRWVGRGLPVMEFYLRTELKCFYACFLTFN